FIIGGLNTLFAYSIYAVCIFIGFHYTLAALSSAVIGTCFSFKTMGTLVFDNPDNFLIFKFVGVYVLGYFLNIGFLRILSQFICKNLYIDGIISAFLVALITFSLNKWVVFRRTSDKR
ncbi:MAG: GtrA family protein, partial [Elusimicrobiaceae bacterium]|nr:GtrA family protein [Elusimicrobiaceae bacterium]